MYITLRLFSIEYIFYNFRTNRFKQNDLKTVQDKSSSSDNQVILKFYKHVVTEVMLCIKKEKDKPYKII